MSDDTVVQENSVGIPFIVTITDNEGCPIDLSPYNTFTIIFRKPDFTTYEVVATPINYGVSGQLTYTSTDSDLAIPGRWHIEVVYEDSTGEVEIYTTIDSFMVDQNLV